MNEQKSKLEGWSIPHILLLLTSIGMIICGIYLTKHYYDAHFPSNLTGSGICYISKFWNCDAAALSSASHIYTAPISLFGTLLGFFLLFGAIFPSTRAEQTNKTLAYINAFGSLVLGIYSIIFLKGLCPICTLYYLFSFVAAYLFYRYSPLSLKLDTKILSSYATVTLVAVLINHFSFTGKEKNIKHMTAPLIKEFYTLPRIGNPQTPSRFRLVSSTQNFNEAPIQLSIFSDFQCPACEHLARHVPKLATRYKGKINIQYYFYPLDNNCNPNIKNSQHLYACKAAYLATCAGPDKFEEVHDIIFENSENLTDQWLEQMAQKYNVTSDCMKSAETAAYVLDNIKSGDAIELSGTPTLVLNGVKINALPPTVFFALMDEILRRAEAQK